MKKLEFPVIKNRFRYELIKRSGKWALIEQHNLLPDIEKPSIEAMITNNLFDFGVFWQEKHLNQRFYCVSYRYTHHII